MVWKMVAITCWCHLSIYGKIWLQNYEVGGSYGHCCLDGKFGAGWWNNGRWYTGTSQNKLKLSCTKLHTYISMDCHQMLSHISIKTIQKSFLDNKHIVTHFRISLKHNFKYLTKNVKLIKLCILSLFKKQRWWKWVLSFLGNTIFVVSWYTKCVLVYLQWIRLVNS